MLIIAVFLLNKFQQWFSVRIFKCSFFFVLGFADKYPQSQEIPVEEVLSSLKELIDQELTWFFIPEKIQLWFLSC